MTTRRGFLGGTLAAAGAALYWPLNAHGRQNSVLGKILGLVNCNSSANEVGRAYLASCNDSPDAEQLLQRITRELGGEGAVVGASQHDLALRFAHATSRDFENGNTVVVKGWVLSASEVSLCALRALT